MSPREEALGATIAVGQAKRGKTESSKSPTKKKSLQQGNKHKKAEKKGDAGREG